MSTTTAATAPSGVRFTEEMRGHVTFGEPDPVRGAAPGRDGAASLMFHLTIEVDDIARFSRDRSRRADAYGWVRSDALGGKLRVQRGVFNLFVDDAVAGDGSKRMLYRLWLHDGVGHPITLSGYKLVRDDPGFDMWLDTTTLFTRVLRGHVEPEQEADAELIASGVLKIRVRDFARQLTTFRTRGGSPLGQLGALLGFGRVFMRHLTAVYLRNGATGRAQE